MCTEACRGTNKLSEFKYRQVFATFFNLGFPRPKRDQCETCLAFRNTTDLYEKDKDVYTEHQNNKQKAKDIKDRADAEPAIPEKKTVALLICREFCCVHTDRALPLTIKCGWEFSTSQSSAIRSKMVSASCGFNTKYREVPMRFQTACLSTFGNRLLRVSNKLKCSQTIAVNKPQKVHCVCLMVCQKEIQHDKTCAYVP